MWSKADGKNVWEPYSLAFCLSYFLILRPKRTNVKHVQENRSQIIMNRSASTGVTDSKVTRASVSFLLIHCILSLATR